MKSSSPCFRRSLAVGSSVTAGLLGLSSAQVIINESPNPKFQTAQIDEFSTDGEEMAGTIFTVNFAGGGTASAPWTSGAPGSESGSAESAGNFLLTLTGQTFDSPWVLTNNNASAIVGFSFSGLEGNTIFDRTFGNTNGTAGSDAGNDFEFGPAFSTWDANVTYGNALQLEGSGGAVGDLFISLDVELTDETIGSGETIQFFQDTDTAQVAGITEVPEPSSVLGLGFLLSSAFLLRRRAK